MITSLQIKDYALIENLNVQFHPGLNIITGETGAGKSILIDSLGLLLGERANTEVVRKGTKKSVVEGIFDVKGNTKIETLLEENDIEQMPELIVRREVSLKGTNRCFLNDTPVTLALVKEAGDLLVDLHGQHEHQSLLRTDLHIEMLDETGEYTGDIKKFSSEKTGLIKAIRELRDLEKRKNEIKEKKDLYEFQIKEIDTVNPEEGEEERLTEELNILENAEKLLELSTSVYTGLYEGENPVYDNLVRIREELAELSYIDKSVAEKEEECNSALALIEDISEFVRSYKDRVELDPEKLEEIRERLSAFNLLKKKYGGTLDKVIEHRRDIGEKFELAENFAERIKEKEEEIDKLRKKAGKTAGELSEKRKAAAEKLKPQVEEYLKYLGITDSVFEARVTNSEPSAGEKNYVISGGKEYAFNDNGIDEVEFFISTNLGEDPKPLAKVASGGEISRIMLALKSVLAKTDKLPLLIFDEIDTGVSGRIGRKVGEALKELSGHHQIIAITHLPQIAGLADFHYAVEKIRKEDRVVSSIRELGREERIQEVAKLMSGEEITEASLQGARELIGGGKNAG